MRRALRVKNPRAQVGTQRTIPAPVRGWNARDSYTSMRPDEAVQLINWFPTTSDVITRKGCLHHLTGVSDGGLVDVETLISYRPMTGSHSLWAFGGTKLWNATTAGSAPAATVSSLTNARWQHINYSSSGGNFVMAVNGADSPLYYNGTTWTAITGVSTPAITGVTASNLIHINLFKGRVWYVEKDTLNAWYTAAGAVTGALTKFALDGVVKRGGYLMAMATWTLDGGVGIDDLAVFITSEGEVALYQGTDPSSASTFALVGIFNIGRPIGRRCFLKYSGDLLILTKTGVVPASKAFSANRNSSAIELTDRISGAMSEAAQAYATTFGWQMINYTGANMLLVNVPMPGDQRQYVMNTNTGAWCQFKAMSARCFEIHNDDLYFGSNGVVMKAWTGTQDDYSGGSQFAIFADAVGAFSYLGVNAWKAASMVRPSITGDATAGVFFYNFFLDTEYVVTTSPGTITLPTNASLTNWVTTVAVGYTFAPHVVISSTGGQFRWSSVDVLFEQGGVI